MELGTRGEILSRYSPFSVDREVSPEVLCELVLEGQANFQTHEAETPSGPCRLVFAPHAWESDYFQRPTVQLAAPSFSCEFDELASELRALLARLAAEGTQTVFAEVPAEDLLWLQALSGPGGFRYLETRLHYRRDRLERFDGPRAPTRPATVADIPNLRRVASEMRNPFDRFHADVRCSDAVADAYLATYVENCVRGLADLVLVPDEPGLPADAFMAARLHSDLSPRLGKSLANLFLSAVSTATNRGWHVRLLSELTHQVASRGAQAAFMCTQASNGAVVHNLEKLGYRLGRVSHLLSCDLVQDMPAASQAHRARSAQERTS